jgi:hypothetical protein
MNSTIQLVLGLPFRLKLTGNLAYLPRIGEVIMLGTEGFEVLSDKHPLQIQDIHTKIVAAIENDTKLVLVIKHIYHELGEQTHDIIITIDKSDDVGKGYGVFQEIAASLTTATLPEEA